MAVTCGRKYPKSRTNSWWQNIVENVVVRDEWRENFRMSRDIYFYFTVQQAQATDGKKRKKYAPVTISYMADEGRYRKVVNAFGISRPIVSKVVRMV